MLDDRETSKFTWLRGKLTLRGHGRAVKFELQRRPIFVGIFLLRMAVFWQGLPQKSSRLYSEPLTHFLSHHEVNKADAKLLVRLEDQLVGILCCACVYLHAIAIYLEVLQVILDGG